MSATLEIGPARRADADTIAALLREAGLPHEDFIPHLTHFLVARDGRGALIGTIGAEVHGAEALLRSFAVAPALRGSGLGSALLAALERAAAQWGVQRWWLLTTTAERYFLARGFRRVSRAEAPGTIAATAEFREACPASAVCLSRERRGAP